MKNWRNYTKKDYKATDIAYLAGIVDGEGSIYIGNFSCNPKTKKPYFQTNLQVTNTDKNLIDWLYDTFGGLVNKRTRKQMPSNSRKDVYVWTASGERLTHLCELIQEFSTCKQDQIKIMLNMRETFSPDYPNKRSDEVTLIRQGYMDEMRALHNRTHSYKNNGSLPRVSISKKT
jgi:hypothetical protein